MPASRFAAYPVNRLVVADLDGDRKLDTATMGASRREGAVQDVTVLLHSNVSITFEVRTAIGTQRLSWSDLDGDADRDLILESFDQPLAVVLNDGGGHFHAGNLEDYRDWLRQREQRSLTVQATDSVSDDLAETSGSPRANLDGCGFHPELISLPLALPAPGIYRAWFHSNAFSRGPPSLS